jgi:hypothetical protein
MAQAASRILMQFSAVLLAALASAPHTVPS